MSFDLVDYGLHGRAKGASSSALLPCDRRHEPTPNKSDGLAESTEPGRDLEPSVTRPGATRALLGVRGH